MVFNISQPCCFHRPHGRLHLGSNQLNIVNDTITQVEIDNVSTSFVDGIEDTVNYRITPRVAGYYLCFGQIGYESAVIDKLYRASIYRNRGIGGSRRIGENERVLTYAGGVINIPVFGEVWLDSNDYVELFAYHFAGVDTVDLTLGEVVTLLMAQRIR